ncbi:LacI family DNA-binding transcriptional regulator [Psychromonas aquimarina]|uniref:LacI family DNA-binding transcriptional regulator n=1 Tax=Psychromonas aquimarina TaxID=444919 RepID=UPI0003F9C919|nr:LacI family DNA-binding transcriptional regulator [Psychromonas aquimarina]
MATINDVSQLANVSIATVSRVLTGSRGVREQSRKAVLDAVRELNYQPNTIARNLARQKSDNISILLSAEDQVRFAKMLPYLEKKLSELGKHMIVHFFHNEEEQGKRLQKLTESSSEAVILLGGYHTDLQSPKLLKVDNKNSDDNSSLNYDYSQAAETATRYLINKGHRNIGLLIDSRDDQGSKDMITGLKVALQEFARPLNSQLIFTTTPSSDQTIISLVKNNRKCTAMIVKRDLQAAEIMNQLREFDLHVPKDLSVISLEGSQLAHYLTPKLTTITYPYELIVNIALTRLESILSEINVYDPPADVHTITGRLVTGDSVITMQ